MQQDNVCDNQADVQECKWEEIQDIIESGELARLKRSRQMTEKYHDHKKRTAGLDMNQYILQKLGWLPDESHCEDTIAKAFSETALYAVRANDFPYSFEPGVVHLVLWSKIALPVHSPDKAMRNAARARIGAFLQAQPSLRPLIETDHVAWFVNYPELQSVARIFHAHVLLYFPRDHYSAEQVKITVDDILLHGFEPVA
ncbi:hypothetical protein SMKI_16G1080 [Saccharomyces mikatae IFO 1815]|uniref:YPL067C-like protein n=1 Tax=Saccharomyces mikatae IFO 1815 TaxID=226126 RepID=A0AA35NFP7_SACMI|nr:uncharacterized protein SMKI_16G1080 [Saccharomyces mikatae IFO 1815]CAI4036810.1 hypothetical protein SMKI_16G1080 [Saccharomyces mikatae IFO 1815]